MLLHNFINHPSLIFNKNYIIKKGGYNEGLEVYEDYELWLRIMNESKFKVIPKYLVFMREYHKSLGRKDFAKNKNIIFEMQRAYHKNSHPAKKDKNDKVFAWREYFYGEKDRARDIWLKNKKLFWKDYRVILAFFLTFFPASFFEYLLSLQLRLKLHFIMRKTFNPKFRQKINLTVYELRK